MSKMLASRLGLLLVLMTLFACGGGDGEPDGGSISHPDGALPDGALPDGALPDGALPDGSAADAGAPPPPTCGNGALDEGERCDAELLGGASCESEVGAGGTLACAGNCLDFDTSGCECLPRSCDALECGEVDDGCGGTMDCGQSCPGALSCGGAGVAGRCGQPCGDCPAGSACDADGVCAGFDSTDLTIAFALSTVSFAVTPGGSRAPSCESITAVRVTGAGGVGTILLTCSGGIARGSAGLPPGEYTAEAWVSDYGWLHPQSFSVGSSARVVSLSATLESVRGHVRHNGNVPARDVICTDLREPSGRLHFLNAAGVELAEVLVDCRDQFSFDEITLERGRYELILDVSGTDFAAIEVGGWPVLLGELEISGPESDLLVDFRTYHLGGIFTQAGRPVPCSNNTQTSIRIRPGTRPWSINQSQHTLVCDASEQLNIDIELPYGHDFSWSSYPTFLPPYDADTTGFDEPGAWISGPFVYEGAYLACTETGELSFSDAWRSQWAEPECVGGRLGMPETFVLLGTVAGTFGYDRQFELEIVGDRLDTDIELEPVPPTGSVRGAVAGDASVICDASLTIESVAASGLSGEVDCDSSMVATWDAYRVRTGTWPIWIESATGSRIDLGSVMIIENEQTTYDVSVPVAADDAVRVGVTYDGVVPTGVTAALARADGRSGDRVASLPAPLPAHVSFPESSLELYLTTGSERSVWVRDSVSLPLAGDFVLDVSPVMVSGTLALTGAGPAAGCTSLGRLTIGNARGDVDCSGHFGPLAVEPGVSAVRFELGDIDIVSLSRFAGPTLRVE